ncbi:uncharacterized protein [Hyperolius riggenbachi]|uniref:uncharacterized protein n=1 Tax=Hyperolius riggenbachi TaxID=752182 RepID=UPI0035A2AE00
MDNIRSVIHLLQSNDYLATIDLKDAYLHLPIHLSSQQYLRFAVWMEGKKSRSISLRKAMAVLGILTSSFPAVQWGQFHSRFLQSWILRSWNRSLASLDKKLIIPQNIKASLLWWQKAVHLSPGRLWNYPQQVTITTDASLWGWGAHFNSQPAQGKWSVAERSQSSNSRELEAVWQALCHFNHQITDCHVKIETDNRSVVAFLNRQGGTRSQSLWETTARILFWAEKNLRSLTAIHLKGTSNQVADYLSRKKLDPNEWSLDQEIFHQVALQWGYPEVDLFARRGNAKCHQFCALFPKDLPWKLDAFTVDWGIARMYAFPPIPLLSRVIKKIVQDQARVILIAPLWPKRPWFTYLKKLAVSDPIVFPLLPHLISQGPVQHPDLARLHLSAWNLNGAC